MKISKKYEKSFECQAKLSIEIDKIIITFLITEFSENINHHF